MPATEYCGHADSATIESTEDGFELVIETEFGRYRTNVQRIAQELHDEVKKEIGGWLAEGVAAAAQHQVERDLAALDAAAYDTSDPKHPAYHSTHADLWDSREGK